MDKASESNPVDDWLRDNTVPWTSPLPQHCLVELGSEYFDYRNELAEPPYTPKFFHDARKAGKVTELNIVQNIRKEYAEKLRAENPAERFQELLSLKRYIRDRAETLAEQIDDRYQATDPETGESTNLVDQTESLIQVLKSSDNSSETELGDFFDREGIEREWQVTKEVSPDIWAEVRLREALSDFSESRRRPCLETSEIGYDLDFTYLPADASIEKVLSLLEIYFHPLQSDAENLKNTHALLCHRLQSLQSVLRDYALYGEVREGDTREDRMDWQQNRRQENKGGRPKELDESRFKRAMAELIGKDPECWHGSSDRHSGVNKSCLVGKMLNEYPRVVKRPDGDLFSLDYLEQRAREILEEMGDAKLKAYREQAHGQT
jgi:hypothetical protein